MTSTDIPESRLPIDDAQILSDAIRRLDRSRRILGERAILGIADLRLLWLLSYEGPLTLRQMADHLGLEQSTVNRQANAAVTAGLLTRSREGSGLPYLFRPSEHGAAQYTANLERSRAIYERALAALGPDRDRFLANIATYVEAFDAAVTDATAPSSPGGVD